MLIQVHKQLRIWKAKRARSLRGRPEWQDRPPDTPEQRVTYAIADRHVGKFSSAFMEAIGGMLTEEDERDFKRAWRAQSYSGALAAIPLLRDDDSEARERFTARIRRTYTNIVQEAGEDATKRMNREFGTNMRFQIGGEEVAKAKKKKKPVWELVVVQPVNPYSVKWIEDRALELVTQGVSGQQIEVLRTTLQDGFERGLRAEEAYKEIKENIGLTNREANAVINRRIMHEEAGLPPERVETLTNKYRESLLRKRAERIARTETIAAQAQGRQASWKLADEAGMLPAVERVWISAPPSGAPGRPCEFCEYLNDKTAPIDGVYEGLEGPVDMPPLHPSCRCSESLRKVKKGG